MDEDERITRRFLPTIVKRLRAQARLSQQQLADSVGVSKGFISGIEGGRCAPSLDVLIQLADALNTPAGTLVSMVVDEHEAARQSLRQNSRR